MKIPYENYEHNYLRHARCLTRKDTDPHAAVILCKQVYEALNEKNINDKIAVHVKFFEIYYADKDRGAIIGNRLLFELLFGFKAPCDIELVNVDEFLCILKPIMLELSLVDRVIGSLRTVGWEYKPIIDLCNVVIDIFLPQLQNKLKLLEAQALLKKMRKEFCRRLIPLDNNHEWLSGIINHEGSADSEICTIKVLKKLVHTESRHRFTRPAKNRYDPHGRIRDRWWFVVKKIRKKLKPENFFLVPESKIQDEP